MDTIYNWLYPEEDLMEKISKFEIKHKNCFNKEQMEENINENLNFNKYFSIYLKHQGFKKSKNKNCFLVSKDREGIISVNFSDVDYSKKIKIPQSKKYYIFYIKTHEDLKGFIYNKYYFNNEFHEHTDKITPINFSPNISHHHQKEIILFTLNIKDNKQYINFNPNFFENKVLMKEESKIFKTILNYLYLMTDESLTNFSPIIH